MRAGLPVPGRRRPAARALLDTEAGTALHLARALEGTPYPYLFPSVVGYELDAAEPFLLYAAPRGVPVGRTQLTSAADHRVFARDLALALCLLDGEGLVPRGVSPATVHWDGTALQLWGLEGTARIGRPRSPWGRAPYCSPEQRRGEGHVDARDAVWSAAQVLYQVVTGRAGPADRAPEDLARHRALAGTLPRAFAPAAAGRPTPAALLELLAPEDARRLLPVAAGAARTRHEAFDRTLEAKRRASAPLAGDPASGADGAAGAEAAPGDVLCPYCLEEIRLDLSHLYVTDDRNQYQPLDLSGITNPVRRDDAMRAAVQRCAADPDFPDHYIPVPYLTHGRPLTVAMIGQSSAGKSHLLTQMIAEITDGGLRRYGVDWQSVNPEQHARFVRERVQPLRSGKVLAHTGSVHDFAQFVESLLLTDAHGRVRPVAFFDLGGEDLVRTDEVLRFLLGVDALIFVVDPVLALPLPQLDSLRADLEVEVDRDGDTAFGTVLDRLPRKGPYLETPAVMVLGKADLLRFQPPVDRWLEEGPPRSARTSSWRRARTSTRCCTGTRGRRGCAPSTRSAGAPCTSRRPPAGGRAGAAIRRAHDRAGCWNPWCRCWRCTGSSRRPGAPHHSAWEGKRSERRPRRTPGERPGGRKRPDGPGRTRGPGRARGPGWALGPDGPGRAGRARGPGRPGRARGPGPAPGRAQ